MVPLIDTRMPPRHRPFAPGSSHPARLAHTRKPTRTRNTLTRKLTVEIMPLGRIAHDGSSVSDARALSRLLSFQLRKSTSQSPRLPYLRADEAPFVAATGQFDKCYLPTNLRTRRCDFQSTRSCNWLTIRSVRSCCRRNIGSHTGCPSSDSSPLDRG
jgi:hypothetical protein